MSSLTYIDSEDEEEEKPVKKTIKKAEPKKEYVLRRYNMSPC